ncbi:MAG: Brp/Blh family beta-carotene 15,15'-dioxygenase [Polaribacter sp.]
MRDEIFTHYQNFMIFFTFLLFWFGIQFGEIVEDSFAFFLVITIGILHGANDLLILSKRNFASNKNVNKNLLIYLFMIGLCVLLFFLNSFLAIIIFIIISAFHFGEEHFSEKIKQNSIESYFYFFVYGLIVFAMLFYNSEIQLKEIMIDLVGVSFSPFLVKLILLISGLLFLLMSIYFYFKKQISIKTIMKELFYLMFLFLVFKTTSLIFGFAIYFILWHSLPSILHQVLFLSGEVNKQTILKFIKKALLFWVISAVGILLLYFLTPSLKLFSSSLFAVLFAVTAPHMWVMSSIKTNG